MPHRHMYCATGQPGWMRHGPSPQGLCAQLAVAGKDPAASSGGPRGAGVASPTSPSAKAARLSLLRAQAEAAASRFEELRAEIDSLEAEG